VTTHQPRDYQAKLEQDIYAAWHAGSRNVLAVLPTGGGKTFIFSRVAAAAQTAVCVSAHRRELVGQMSIALAREGVRHRVIGPDSLMRSCASLHMDEFQRSFIDPNGRVAVASVDTLANMSANDPWLQQVGLWVQDEAHHVLAENKWGRACALFPNAYGLGVTATPTRADGKGLGRDADGVMDVMVTGPSMRELIQRGYLTDYRIFAPPSDLDLSQVPTTDSGDYSPPKLKQARQQSHITGDVVAHYLRIARGKLGVTFDTDIESATQTAAAYNAAGVPAEVVSSKTPELLRARVLRRFRNRDILQLVNVDLFGEGFDLPAIEVVSMARPTQSYGLYCQQFGRALRIMDGKLRAIIIDHVGNVQRHGLPDAPRMWSLDRRERRSRTAPSDVIPVRTCLNETCMAVYERVYKACPFCGFEVVPAGRSSPEQVDGDLHELDEAALKRMRGEIEAVDRDVPFYPTGAAPEVKGAIYRRHIERRQAQTTLRSTIALWAGWQDSLQRSSSENYRRFFLQFGTDVMTAKALGAREAEDLTARIQRELNAHNVIERVQ
jgi:DNA repair protein RadD